MNEDLPSAEAEKAAYQHNWGFNAANYENQGCYEWMAAQLDDTKPRKVFDIGCGTGEGVAAIRQRFSCNILSIDENPFCLRKTAAALRSLGAKVQTRERLHYYDDGRGRHILTVDESPISLSREVMLVQADVLLADDRFHEFLLSKAPFDAVTIWLIGAYMGRQSCVNLHSLNMQQSGEYRLHVQNRTYELAAKILRKGGVLQVVDRGEMLKTQFLRDDFLAAHREQASVTDLEVQSLTYRQYNEHTEGPGVSMISSPGTSGRIPDTNELAMISILSKKP